MPFFHDASWSTPKNLRGSLLGLENLGVTSLGVEGTFGAFFLGVGVVFLEVFVCLCV